MNFFRKKDAPSDSSAMSPIKEPATEQTTPENERTTEKEQTSEEPPEQTNVVDDDDDESRYPTAFPFALITLALCLSIFCMSLDNTIIAVSRFVRSSRLPICRSPLRPPFPKSPTT